MYGKNLIVHGGKTMKGHHFNDLWQFDVHSFRWYKLNQDFERNLKSAVNYYPDGISYHKAVPVF